MIMLWINCRNISHVYLVVNTGNNNGFLAEISGGTLIPSFAPITLTLYGNNNGVIVEISDHTLSPTFTPIMVIIMVKCIF